MKLISIQESRTDCVVIGVTAGEPMGFLVQVYDKMTGKHDDYRFANEDLANAFALNALNNPNPDR